MTNQKQIVFISPPTSTNRTPEECLGLEYLAAESRLNGFIVNYIDAWIEKLNILEIVKKIKSISPTIVGLSPSMDSFKESVKIVNALRRDGFGGQIIMGGVFASFEAEKLLTLLNGKLDGILSGEADNTLQTFLKTNTVENIPGAIYIKNGKIVREPKQKLNENLDDLPMPARDTFGLVQKLKTPSHVMGSRGCYGNCSFCSVACFQQFSSEKRWRGRSPESIATELISLQAKGETMVKFVDDNFFSPGDGKREKAFANLLMKAGIKMRFRLSLRANDVSDGVIGLLKNAGLFAVSIGIESFVSRKLRDYAKGITATQNLKAVRILNKHGIYIQMGFIMFDPYITIPEIKQELKYLEKIPWVITKGICTKLFAADGTPITKRIAKEIGYVGKEGANNLYEIRDWKARSFYNALKVWAAAVSPIYEKTIDPISAPKNISPKLHAEFHALCVQLKNMDIAVANKLINNDCNFNQEELISLAKKLLSQKRRMLNDINRKSTNLYKKAGICYCSSANLRL